MLTGFYAMLTSLGRQGHREDIEKVTDEKVQSAPLHLVQFPTEGRLPGGCFDGFGPPPDSVSHGPDLAPPKGSDRQGRSTRSERRVNRGIRPRQGVHLVEGMRNTASGCSVSAPRSWAGRPPLNGSYAEGVQSDG